MTESLIEYPRRGKLAIEIIILVRDKKVEGRTRNILAHIDYKLEPPADFVLPDFWPLPDFY